ncbi:MAG: PAS domain S-box protein [Planctomycetota bacterium]
MTSSSIANDAFEAAPTGLVIVNAEGIIEHRNNTARALAKRLGPEGCGPGRSIAYAFPSPYAETVEIRIRDCLAARPAPPLRVPLRTTSVEVELRFSFVQSDRCVIAVIDVEGTDDAERRLRQNEQRLAAHFTKTPLASIEWNIDRTARLWNPAAEAIFGYTAREAAEQDLFPALVAPESRSTVDRVWAALCSASGGEAVTNTNVTKDGRTILCRWYNTPLLDDRANVIGVASLAEDITERALAERRVRDSERRLQSIVDRLPVLVWALDDQHRPVFWNTHAESVSGLAADDVLTPDGARRIFPADAGNLDALLDKDFDAVERPLPCSDGSVRRILWSNVATRCVVPGWAAWGVGIDVTELQQAKRAARESERRFREVFHAVELAGILLDADGRVLDCNQAMLNALEAERDDLVGHDWIRIGVPESERTRARNELADALSAGNYARRHERPIISRTGRTREMIWTRSLLRDADGRPVAACAFGLDVTDQRRAEVELAEHRDELERLVERRTAALQESTRQLARAEHLASVGQLAAGVGHDINNIIFPVRCHLDTLKRHNDTTVADAVNAASTGLSVLGQLAESLRKMDADTPIDKSNSAEPTEKPAPTNLAEWWRQSRPLIDPAVPDSVAFETYLEPNLPLVRADANQLTQATLNIVLNAVEALDHDRPAKITLRITSEGKDVQIQVTDNGRGMTESMTRRVIEPFYTTKTRGISTGLGLSIVHAFAKASGGDFVIKSDPGTGTVVTLRLKTVDPDEQQQRFKNPTQHGTATRTAAIHIKDPRLQAIHRSVLEDLGWTVLPADASQTQQKHINLLVVDDREIHEIPPVSRVVRVVPDTYSKDPEAIDPRAGLAELRGIYSSLGDLPTPGRRSQVNDNHAE